jgi:F-type H+/Na+-transporting ATPase subunit alpha
MIEFESGIKGIVLNLEQDNVGVVLLGPSERVKEGDTVKRLQRIASIMVGEKLVGRVVNTIGEPIDGLGPIGGELIELPLERKAPGVIFRQPVREPLQTGLKAIDAMIPIGRGQRELIIGDRQTGKTAVAIDTIINQRENFEKENRFIVFMLPLDRKAPPWQHCFNTAKHGAMDYTIIVSSTASDPAALAILCPLCRNGHWRIFSGIPAAMH